ncbi:hypothetical protein [Myxococcus sp. RHSTA-1-4]|uniref:hypothetical protein n=1 Tax=Myxococcus sp. RHSTA-1-4 TaxID=2874601 RepID=UPI001CC080EE|nr:hypothetical protein [Myxococcus sp. RHSTA-1-4]MBZ4418042.1 hypothetical protein [Myxococcus sp. RHSTA-1-4]
MKAKILAGAVAALMYGTAALAADGDCPPPRASTGSAQGGVMLAQAQDEMPMDDVQQDVQQQEEIEGVEPVPDATGVDQDTQIDEGIGGSGTLGQEPSAVEQEPSPIGQEEGIGGSGKGEVLLRCEPISKEEAGVGGAGVTPLPGIEEPKPVEPQPMEPQPMEPQPMEPQTEAYPEYPPEDATGGSGIATPPPSDFRPSAEAAQPIEPLEVEAKEKNDMTGLTLLAGGGLEGYTGELGSQLNPGATAGVRAALKPNKIVGLELGYSGAVNDIDIVGTDDNATDGPDLVRNGGDAVLTLGLLTSAWQPYVLGGIGINDYNFRGGQTLGYSDDTVGSVPAGVGLRGHVGHFTVDARANYNFLFDKEFAPGVESSGGDFEEGGSYQAVVNVGGTF